MRLILNKRFFIPFLSLIFFVLILASLRFRLAMPTYAYLVNDWDTVVNPGPGINVDHLNPSFHLVSLPDGNTVRRVYGVDSWVEDLIPSPSKQLGIFQGADSAFPRSRKMIRLWDGSVQIYAFDQQLREPNVWSPDSAYLTVGIQRPCTCNLTTSYVDLGIVDVNNGHLRVLTDGEFIAQDFRSAAWSPDGTALTYVDQQFDPSMARADMVKWIAVDGSQPARTLFTRPGVSGTWLHWLSDGEQVAVIAMATWPEVWFINVETAQVAFHYTSIRNFDICWSPKTDHFVVSSESGFALITPDGLLPLDVSFVDPSIWKVTPAADDSCAWSPDGNKLALVQSNRSSSPIVQIIDFEKRSVSEIRVDHPARFLISHWSPDSRMLALKTYRPLLESGDTYMYDISTMQQIYYQTHANFLSWLPQLP